jgi:hypothetical protein
MKCKNKIAKDPLHQYWKEANTKKCTRYAVKIAKATFINIAKEAQDLNCKRQIQ